MLSGTIFSDESAASMFRVEEFFYLEAGANRFLQNGGNFLPDYMLSHRSWNPYLCNFARSSTMN
jgi:hypothetical protein